MPIQNYPRFLTQSSKTNQQVQTGLPIIGSDGTTSNFNSLKVNTDGSINVAGGGGGDATAANQTTQINEAIDSNTYLSNIDINTGISNSGVKISNLLESTGGTSAADILDLIQTLTVKVQKFSQWNSYSSKTFYNSSGTNTIPLNGAVKIVFNSNNVEILNLLDALGTNVTVDYAYTTGTSYLLNQGSEIISNGNSANDLFQSIDIVGTAHITAYYLISPYVTP